jgi:hypothetical protein
MSVPSTIYLQTGNDNIREFPDLIVRLNRAIRAVGSEWSASFSSEVMTTMDDAVREIERLRGLISQYRVERGRVVVELERFQLDLLKVNAEVLKQLHELITAVAGKVDEFGVDASSKPDARR